MSNNDYKNRILVVDDNQSIQYLFKKILEDKFTLLCASGGQEALQILNDQAPPDLILLDIMMPEMDGYSLFEEIKKDARIASIPIIFVTALGSEADEVKGLETGAVDYIVKPIDQSVLIARITNILELSRYQQDNREKLPETSGELFPDEMIEMPSSNKPEEDKKDKPSRVIFIDYDQEAALFDLIKHELSPAYEVVHFYSGVEALKSFKQEKNPDLILLDIDHSQENRFELIKQLKNDKQTQSIPIILLTAHSSNDDETKAFQIGSADYLTKPVIPSILKARIRIHLELKKHRDQFEQQLEAFMNN